MQHHPEYRENWAYSNTEDGCRFGKKFEHFLEIVEYRSQENADDVLYTFLDDGDVNKVEELTFSQLELRAKGIGALLQGSDPVKAKRKKALLVFPFDGFEFNVAFYACLCTGVTAVPTYPPDPRRLERSLPRFTAILTDCMPEFCLTTSWLFNKFKLILEQFPELKMIKWICTDDIPDESADDWVDPGLSAGSTALIQYTSGSTGLPKGAMITHGNLLYNLEVMAINFSTTTRVKERVLCTWLPLFHDMGLIGNMLYPHFLGVRSVVLSPISFLKNPMCYLRALSHFKAHAGCMPNFGYELLVRRAQQNEGALEGLDLSHWRVAFCGAEPVRPGTVNRFCDLFAKYGFHREAFYPCYGLAECTLMVSGGNVDEGTHFEHVRAASLQNKYSTIEFCDEGAPGSVTIVSSGHNQTGSKLPIVHADTFEELPDCTVGEIWVSGPTVAKGYYGKRDLSKAVFQARLMKNGEADLSSGPYCRTGDLGFFKDGWLFVTGRIKDLIIIRGRNLYPHDIEATVEDTSDVIRRGCVTAFSVERDDQEVLVVVAEVYSKFSKDEVQAMTNRIREAVSRVHETQVTELVFVGSGELHKTSSGKVQRSLEKQVFEDGDTEALFTWSVKGGLQFTKAGQDVVDGKVSSSKRKLDETPDFSKLAAAAEREAEREARRQEREEEREERQKRARKQ